MPIAANTSAAAANSVRRSMLKSCRAVEFTRTSSMVPPPPPGDPATGVPELIAYSPSCLVRLQSRAQDPGYRRDLRIQQSQSIRHLRKGHNHQRTRIAVQTAIPHVIYDSYNRARGLFKLRSYAFADNDLRANGIFAFLPELLHHRLVDQSYARRRGIVVHSEISPAQYGNLEYLEVAR